MVSFSQVVLVPEFKLSLFYNNAFCNNDSNYYKIKILSASSLVALM